MVRTPHSSNITYAPFDVVTREDPAGALVYSCTLQGSLKGKSFKAHRDFYRVGFSLELAIDYLQHELYKQFLQEGMLDGL
jgi:hypothetical protein